MSNVEFRVATQCIACGRAGAYVCGGCHGVLYCTRKCQRDHRAAHQIACKRRRAKLVQSQNSAVPACDWNTDETEDSMGNQILNAMIEVAKTGASNTDLLALLLRKTHGMISHLAPGTAAAITADAPEESKSGVAASPAAAAAAAGTAALPGTAGVPTDQPQLVPPQPVPGPLTLSVPAAASATAGVDGPSVDELALIDAMEESKDQMRIYGGVRLAFFDATTTPLQVMYRHSMGRFVIARRTIPSETNVMAAELYAAAPSPPSPQLLVCYHCFKCAVGDKIVCKTCKQAVFCSATCMSNAERVHSFICPVLPRLAHSSLEFDWREGFAESLHHLAVAKPEEVCKDALLLALQILGRRAYEQTLSPEDLAKLPVSYADVEALGHYEARLRRFSEAHSRAVRSAGRFLHDLLTPELRGTLTQVDTSRLLLRIKCNAHNVVLPLHGTRIGLGLYPAACFFNHSCVPNAICFPKADGSKLHVRVIKAIPPGGEVCVSYCTRNAYSTVIERQRFLDSAYMLQCKCEQCTHPELEPQKFVNAVICSKIPADCPRTGGEGVASTCDGAIYMGYDAGGPNPPVPCPKCGRTVSFQWYQQQIIAMHTSSWQSCASMIKMSSPCLPLLTDIMATPFFKCLHPFHERVHSLQAIAMFVARVEMNLREGLQLGLKVLEAEQRVTPWDIATLISTLELLVSVGSDDPGSESGTLKFIGQVAQAARRAYGFSALEDFVRCLPNDNDLQQQDRVRNLLQRELRAGAY